MTTLCLLACSDQGKEAFVWSIETCKIWTEMDPMCHAWCWTLNPLCSGEFPVSIWRHLVLPFLHKHGSMELMTKDRQRKRPPGDITYLIQSNQVIGEKSIHSILFIFHITFICNSLAWSALAAAYVQEASRRRESDLSNSFQQQCCCFIGCISHGHV